LAEIVQTVQSYTANLSDESKGAVLAYVSQALTAVDNRLQLNQDGATDALKRFSDSGLASTANELQVQRGNIKNALNTLVGSGLSDFVSQFGQLSYYASRLSEDNPSINDKFNSALKSVSDGLSLALTKNTSATDRSFIFNVVKGFTKEITDNLSKQQSDSIGKLIYTQLSAESDKATQTFAKLLLQVTKKNPNSASSSKDKVGLLVNAKA
jgi:hypothetical protein